MYVKNHMTSHVITIQPDTTLLKALEIMGKNHFHRLPVLNKEGKLVGLITEGLINDSSGKKATSLSIYELNYLLSRTTAQEIMIKDIKTIYADAFLEEAVEMMVKNSINVLPVLNEANDLVGIITDKDIFRTFIDVMGLHRKGMRLVLEIQDIPGEFAKITKLFAQEGVNLENLAVYHPEGKAVVMVKASGGSSAERMVSLLQESGYVVTNALESEGNGEYRFLNV